MTDATTTTTETKGIALVVSHVAPDMDSIASSFLAKIYAEIHLGMDVEFAFYPAQPLDKIVAQIPANSPSTDRPIAAVIVVDIGEAFREYILPTGMVVVARDHHQHNNKDWSATSMMWDLLHETSFQWEGTDSWWRKQWLEDIKPFVELITDGDWMRGTSALDFSKKFGLHAVLNNVRGLYFRNEQGLFDFMLPLVGCVTSEIYKKAKAARDLPSWIDEQVKVGDTNWLLLKYNAPRELTDAAYELGYGVVFYSSDQGGRGVVRRSADQHIHLGDYLTLIIDEAETNVNLVGEALLAEIKAWYKHAAGFMIGLSPKGNASIPEIQVSFKEIFHTFIRLAQRFA